MNMSTLTSLWLTPIRMFMTSITSTRTATKTRRANLTRTYTNMVGCGIPIRTYRTCITATGMNDRRLSWASRRLKKPGNSLLMAILRGP